MMDRTARGAALPEYAIAVPLLLTWLFVAIQFAMIVVQDYSVMQGLLPHSGVFRAEG